LKAFSKAGINEITIKFCVFYIHFDLFAKKIIFGSYYDTCTLYILLEHLLHTIKAGPQRLEVRKRKICGFCSVCICRFSNFIIQGFLYYETIISEEMIKMKQIWRLTCLISKDLMRELVYLNIRPIWLAWPFHPYHFIYAILIQPNNHCIR
jgi:hypothetical protein